jgi:hypothetical protein
VSVFSVPVVPQTLSHPYFTIGVPSAARLRGFEEDLHLKGQEFATLLSILYVGYVLFVDPSEFLSTKFRYIIMQIPS